MKAIISREVNGQFAEVGTMNRTVVTCASKSAVRRRAKSYSRNGAVAVRVEYFTENNFYGEPSEVKIFPAGDLYLGVR